MKNIAYIEIDTHAEIAGNFMDLMEDSEVFSVDYYFSERVKKQIFGNDKDGVHKGIFLSDHSVILGQLKAKKYDLIIIGTVHRYFNVFLTITKQYHTAVLVHNSNFSKASTLSLLKNIFREDFMYRLKLLGKEGLLYSSEVCHHAKFIFVLDEKLSSANYRFLPLFYTKQFTKNENESLTVVIPGGVSQKRRDYKHILSVIRKSESAKNIVFVFLGKAKGEELNELRNIADKFNTIYFTERVSQKDFESWMKKADVLWCPIQQKTKFFSQEELYGSTKMTGTIGDAITYGKIAVFPKEYSSDLDFIIAEKEDVIQQFYDLRDFNYDFQKKYDKKLIINKLENILLDVI